jgi:hypothetical protein
MSEAKSSISKGGTVTFPSPLQENDSDLSVLQQMIFYMYGRGEFPKAKKLQ